MAAGAIVCLLSVSMEMASSLADIREEVEENFSSVQSIYVTIDKYSSNVSTSRDETLLRYCEWAFDADGRISFASSDYVAIPHDEDPPRFTNVVVFDGALAKGVGYASEGVWKQLFGSIFHERKYQTMLVKNPSAITEFGRMWGYHLNGRSLPDWLAVESAQVAGNAMVGGVPCVVVEVEHSVSSGPRIYRFTLSIDHEYALKRYDTVRNGEVVFTLIAEEFREYADGVWFPVSGFVDPHGRQDARGSLEGYKWRVRDLLVNEALPDEIFELEFDPGLEVFDQRFGIPLFWESGMDVEAAGLTDEFMELVVEAGGDPNPRQADSASQGNATTGESNEHEHVPQIEVGVWMIIGGSALVMFTLVVVFRGKRKVSRKTD